MEGPSAAGTPALARAGGDLRHGSPRHLGGVFGLEAEESQDALGVVAVRVPGRLSVEHGAHDGQKRASARAGASVGRPQAGST